MSPEQLSQVVASVVKGAQPAEIPKAFDQAEFDKTFNVVKVAKEDLDVLAQGGEKAVEKMHDLLQRTSKQAVTMTNYLVEDRMKNLMGQLQPYLQFANEMRESQFRGEFMDKNKDLAEYSPIVDEVVQNLNRSGIKGSKEEIFTKISTEARRLIAVAGGKLTVPAGAGQPGGQPSIMPTLPSGGQRGASTGGSDKSLAENIFGG